MKHYVYIIESEVDGTYYKGYSQHPINRLEQHNGGKTRYTMLKIPWKLIYIQSYPTKKEALIRERALKSIAEHKLKN
ncbi:MAG: GIY-YIG nuclease family protein [Saprospiraceae bacterium]|nr:GIY-YIG nuclease family protein [Saprospiraceae bacterium]